MAFDPPPLIFFVWSNSPVQRSKFCNINFWIENDPPRRSNTGFGIWDLPQKSSTKAKFGTLGLNWDFFGTIFISFWDCYTVLHLRVRNLGLACKIGTFLGPNLDFGPIWHQVPNLGLQ